MPTEARGNLVATLADCRAVLARELRSLEVEIDALRDQSYHEPDDARRAAAEELIRVLSGTTLGVRRACEQIERVLDGGVRALPEMRARLMG